MSMKASCIGKGITAETERGLQLMGSHEIRSLFLLFSLKDTCSKPLMF